METWRAFHSQDGPDGSRNALGQVLFPSNVATRSTRLEAAGVVPPHLPYAANTLVDNGIAMWNKFPALREASTKRMASNPELAILGFPQTVDAIVGPDIAKVQVDMPDKDVVILGISGPNLQSIELICPKSLSIRSICQYLVVPNQHLKEVIIRGSNLTTLFHQKCSYLKADEVQVQITSSTIYVEPYQNAFWTVDMIDSNLKWKLAMVKVFNVAALQFKNPRGNLDLTGVELPNRANYACSERPSQDGKICIPHSIEDEDVLIYPNPVSGANVNRGTVQYLGSGILFISYLTAINLRA
eukprot:maker-scaffold286_size222086-snap-gene-1.23 protein:Tk07262 transcript:maker-scaffold286_size222086-snap-gene-1.23-mRNA-1 annotation:"mammalian cell entry related domain protein"